ncbi:hypothetical protein Q7P35_010695 [Cladosporium inversicolor]
MDADGPQRPSDSRSNQLTTTNLAAHGEATPTVSSKDQQNGNNKLQRWLAYRGDSQLPTREAREARDWSRLVESDEVAAAIESATRGEGDASRRQET